MGHIRVPYLVMSSQKQWNRRTSRLSSKSQAVNIMPDGNGNSIQFYQGKTPPSHIADCCKEQGADVAFLPCNQLMVEVFHSKQQVVGPTTTSPPPRLMFFSVFFQSVSSLPVIFQVLFQLLVLPIATASQMMVLVPR